MKINTLVTKLDESELKKLNYFDHRIIYQDKNTNTLKVAIPDYYNLIIDETNLQEALSSDKVMVVKRYNPINPNSIKPLTMLTIDNGVIVSINGICNDIDSFVQDLTMDGKSLVKMLK